MRFEVSTAVTIHVEVLWAVTLCGDDVDTNVSEDLAASIFRIM
jgi:hypothetical protein